MLSSCGNASAVEDEVYPDSGGEITRAHFLYDLQYLERLFETSFPAMPTVYRHGFDWRAGIAQMADFIKNAPDMNHDLFLTMLLHYVFHYSMSCFHSHAAGMVGPVTYFGVINSADAFQGEQTQNSMVWNLRRHHIEIMQNSPLSYYHFSNITPSPIWASPPFGELRRLRPWREPHFRHEVAFSMRPIEEGRIAYFSLRDSVQPGTWGRLQEQLFELYKNSYGYEHFIIDLRGQGGGDFNFFGHTLLMPFVDGELATHQRYAFFMDCEHSRAFAEIVFNYGYGRGLYRAADANIYPIDQMPSMRNGGLPMLHPDSRARLSYGFGIEFTIGEYKGQDGEVVRIPTWEGEPPNIGNIWILVSERTGSAAEVFAMMAQELGVATIVGTPTHAGFIKIGEIIAVLPNTGAIVGWNPLYITDSQGRLLYEHHVTPCIPNRPGMDALQTVLAIINE